MIQKAIVESIENNYQVKVRIPKYDKLASDSDGKGLSDLSTGVLCTIPGTLINYSVGDVVLVGFENDEISKPIVLGLLYTNNAVSSTTTGIEIPSIQETLDSVSDNLTSINKSNSYIHIKYSNDGGSTFTSLYDYSKNTITQAGNNYIYERSDIEINTNSKYIYWSITDSNNSNRFNNVTITTNIVMYDASGNIVGNYSSNDSIIEIPIDLSNYYQIFLSYRISTPDTTFNISLTTDKDILGSVAGDYIGFYPSTSSIPSLNPVDYSWCSIRARIQDIIDELMDSLLERVRTNERALFGKAKDVTELDNKLGLNSVISVAENSANLGLKDTTYLNSNSVIGTSSDNNLFIGNLNFVVTDNNHIQLRNRY